MDQLISWLITLVSGAVGGNAAGAAMKDKSLGPVGNSIAGVVGGGIGGFLLQMLGYAQQGGLDVGTVVKQVASGGIGGAVVLILVSVVKGMMAKKA